MSLNQEVAQESGFNPMNDYLKPMFTAVETEKAAEEPTADCHTHDEALRGVNLLPLAEAAVRYTVIAVEPTDVDGALAVLGTE